MIDQLTPEQEAKIEEYYQRGLRIGLGTERWDQDKVVAAAKALYKAHGLAEPIVYFGRSPREGMAIVETLKAGNKPGADAAQAVFSYNDFSALPENPSWQSGFMWGCQELYWLYYYQYINNELPVEKYDGPLQETIDLCEQTGWFWPFDTCVVITEKPTLCLMNAQNRLHSAKGPALQYSDGYSLYALNGVRLTGVEHLVDAEQSPETVRAILNIRNVEQRAELMKLHGPEKFFEEIAEKLDEGVIDGYTMNDAGQVVPHKFEYGLYKVAIYEDMPRIGLRMINPSVPDDMPFEWVHPDCKTIADAIAYRNFGTVEMPKDYLLFPAVLT